MIFDFRTCVYETDKWEFSSSFDVYNDSQKEEIDRKFDYLKKHLWMAVPDNVMYSIRADFSSKEEAEKWVINFNKTNPESGAKAGYTVKSDDKQLQIISEEIKHIDDKYATLTLFIANDKVTFKFYNDDISAARRNLGTAIRSPERVFCWTKAFEDIHGTVEYR